MRWKAFVPTLIILGLSWVFGAFMLDGVVKRAIEKAGTAANGAKVELDRVNISLSGTSIGLYGLRVTDREQPMTNAVEVEALEFELAGKPLLWKRVIIEKGEIRGIRTGTERKTSGALKEKPSRVKPPDKAEKAGAGEPAAPKKPLADAQEPDDMVKPDDLKAEDLASYRKLTEEREKIENLADGWEKKADKINVDSTVKAAKAWLEKVDGADYSGTEGARRAAQDLEEAKKLAAEIKASGREVAELKAALDGELAQARAALGEIDELKDQDLAGIMEKVKAAGFSAEGIAERAVGPTWLARAKTVLGLIGRIRAMIPERDETEAKPKRPPRTGRDIAFPFRHNWPAFHLKEAALSGETGGGKSVKYSGALLDLTSAPKLVGRPISLRAEGGRQDGASMRLQAELDYTGPRARESLYFRHAGMDLAGMKLGNLGGPVGIRNGAGELVADLTAAGDGVGGKFAFTAAPMKLDHKLDAEKAKDRLLGVIHGVLAAQNRLEVTVLVSGKISGPDFKLRSNLENQLKGAVNEAAKKELEELEARYRARLDSLVNGERDKLAESISGKGAAAAGKLGVKEKSLADVQGQIDKAVEESKKKSAQSAVQSAPAGLKGLLKK